MALERNNMTTVRVMIAGRDYEVACDDGQETYLRGLAKQLDDRAQRLSKSLGKPGEAQLLLLAALTLTDELQDATRELTQCKHDILHSSQSFEMNKQIELETAIAGTINDIASRIESIAHELEKV